MMTSEQIETRKSDLEIARIAFKSYQRTGDEEILEYVKWFLRHAKSVDNS